MILDRIIQGDVLDTLKDIPTDLVQTVVTSPPYWGLRDYGIAGQLGLEKTVGEYVQAITAIFREVRRVLRPDGTLWLNIGDTYNSGPSGARDPGRWPKQTRNDHKAPRGRDAWMKRKDLCLIPERVAIALQEDGWWVRRDIIWHKPNPMPESAADRPTTSHEYIWLLAKSEDYFYDGEAIQEPAIYGDHLRHGTEGTVIQAPGQPKQSGLTRLRSQGSGGRSEAASLFPGRAGRDDNRRRLPTPAGWNQDAGSHHTKVGRHAPRPSQKRGEFHGKTQALPGREAFRAVTGMRNKRSVWTVATQPFPEAHFATFPEDLITPCILAGSRPGDTVLDPFMGAGTTALVAAKLNRRFLGIELNPAYIKIAERRIESELRQAKLF